MKETFLATLSPMLVMFACIVVGFILNKKKVLPDNAATVLSRLENYVLVPAGIINTFGKNCTVESLKENYVSLMYCICLLFVAIGISLFLSRFFSKGGYERNIYKYALTFGNFGFMGLAIVPAILGEDMLFKYTLYTLPLYAAVYTWGNVALIPSGEKKLSVLQRLLNPICFAFVIGTIIGITGVWQYMPDFATVTIGNCAACMGPLSMILTGFIIGNYKVLSLLKVPKVYVATALRLIVIPSVFLTALYLVGASKEIMLLSLFGFATPLGLNTVVYPAAYGGDTKPGASMAMISHTLCVVTIPLLFALVNAIVK